MQHDVFFDDISAYDAWGLILASPPVIAPPEVKTKLLESPGMDGAIDLTTAIRGYPVFEERTGTMTFVSRDRFARWNAMRSRAMGMLQGHRVVLRFQDDPGWYWEGTCRVRGGNEQPRGATVTIEYRVFPYKYALETTIEPWKWDPFSFVDGVIGNGTYSDESTDPPTVWQGAGAFVNVPLTDAEMPLEYDVSVTGDMPVSPVFTFGGAAGTIIVTVDGSTNSFGGLPNASFSIPGLVLYRGGWLYQGKTATVEVVSGGGPTTFQITDQPVDVTSGIGVDVHFHVGAVSSEEITYQWQYLKPGNSWTTPGTWVGRDTPTMAVPVTNARNGYQFHCLVTSGGETLTSEAKTITVGTPTFAIIQNPEDVKKNPGDSFELFCGAQGSSMTYQWQMKTPTGNWTDISGETSYTLEVSDVSAEDNGNQYRCAVTSGGDTLTSNAATLTVGTGTISIKFRQGRL